WNDIEQGVSFQNGVRFSVVDIESCINLMQELLFEFFEFASLYVSIIICRALIFISNQVGISEDVFKVGQLFLEESILGSEACILFRDLFLDAFEVLDPVFKV